MASDDVVVANDEIYNKEYRRLRTLTSQTDIVEGSVSFWWHHTTTTNNLNEREFEQWGKSSEMFNCFRNTFYLLISIVFPNFLTN